MANAINIIDGPGKYDLFMGLFEDKHVRFKAEHKSRDTDVYIRAISNGNFGRMHSNVEGIERYVRQIHKGVKLDGFGGSWLIEGAVADNYHTHLPERELVYIIYSVTSRQGVMRKARIDDRRSEDARNDMLRLAWGDLIVGNKFWRS